MSENIFLTKGLSQITRILGFIDRNPRSRTYGCLDRYYWHYKILDFPNARFQEAALVFAAAYLINAPSNRFYKSEMLREWAKASVAFWSRMRHRDGSTDESYPFERHFCSTAFSCYAVTESLMLLHEKAMFNLEKTGNFLTRHDNKDVSNQVAAAATALFNVYTLTGKERYRAGYEDKIALLLERQRPDGSFPEYGGFDAGYDSITLSFLGALYRKTKRQDIKDAASRCVTHIAAAVDSEGYCNPERMSRKTQFLYPYGLMVFDSGIMRSIESGLRKDTIVNPSWLDDRYCIPLTADYLMTALEHPDI